MVNIADKLELQRMAVVDAEKDMKSLMGEMTKADMLCEYLVDLEQKARSAFEVFMGKMVSGEKADEDIYQAFYADACVDYIKARIVEATMIEKGWTLQEEPYIHWAR